MKKLLFALVVIAALGGWYWFRHRAPAAGEAEAAPVAHVAVAPLQQRTIARTVEAFGTVGSAPSGEIALAAPFDCIVRTVRVTNGAQVAAGNVLLEIEPTPDARLTLASARTALALAEKTLAAAEERRGLQLATNQELLAARQAAEDARLKVASLEARGLSGSGHIVAPASGVVAKLDLSAGAFAPLGTVLATVAAANRTEARLSVETAQLAEVKPDATVMLTAADRADTTATATVVRSVGTAVDPATGTGEIRVPVPPGAPLLVGERVRGTITVGQSTGFVVPRSAVLSDDSGGHVLFTVADGHAVRHEVKPGIEAGDLIEVAGHDLRAGDRVVTLGNYELTDGMAVEIDASHPVSPAATVTPEAKP